MKKGDSIIVPAFICHSSIQPLQAYGFNLVFIDIGQALELSLDTIKKVAESDDSIKAILAVHYFGLTQNIDEIVNVCKKHEIKVVEDASHSFMSQLLRDRDSIKGEIEIFSMRKSLPVFDGGALRVNNDNYRILKTYNKRYVPIVGDVRYLIQRFFERLATSVGINIYGQFINGIKAKLRSKMIHDVYEYSTDTYQLSYQLRRYLNSEKYLQSTQNKIINNFNQLSQALQVLGFRLLFESIEDNTIPQACVVYDDNGGLANYLRLHGVGAWQWPGKEIPEEVAQNPMQYPNTILFDEKLVLIPIHQSIDNKKIHYIVKVLSQWTSL